MAKDSEDQEVTEMTTAEIGDMVWLPYNVKGILVAKNQYGWFVRETNTGKPQLRWTGSEPEVFKKYNNLEGVRYNVKRDIERFDLIRENEFLRLMFTYFFPRVLMSVGLASLIFLAIGWLHVVVCQLLVSVFVLSLRVNARMCHLVREQNDRDFPTGSQIEDTQTEDSQTEDTQTEDTPEKQHDD